MSALATQQFAYPAAPAPVYSAAGAGGDTFKAGDTTRFLVKNGSGSSINVTIPRYPATDAEGVAETALVVAVPAGAERWIGPMYGSRFTNPASGNVEPTYSSAVTVTVAVIST